MTLGVSKVKNGINLAGNMRNLCLATMQKNEHWNMPEIYLIQQLLNLQRKNMSKGSRSRPFAVSNEEYSNRWDAIFGRDNEKKNETQGLESARPDPTRSNRSSDNTSSDSGQASLP